MTTYKTTCERGCHVHADSFGDAVNAYYPDPLEPELPYYDYEMAQAFGNSRNQPEWELIGQSVVKDSDNYFYIFWTWKLKD